MPIGWIGELVPNSFIFLAFILFMVLIASYPQALKDLAGNIPSRQKVLRISRNGSWEVQLARNAPTLKTVLASTA